MFIIGLILRTNNKRNESYSGREIVFEGSQVDAVMRNEVELEHALKTR